MKKIIFTAILLMSAGAGMAQSLVHVYRPSASTDDIITTLPSTAKDSLYLEDTYIMSGYALQHYTWSGHFHHIAFDENGTDVYIKNICNDYVFDTYIKGTIISDSIVIPTGQHIFHQDAGEGQDEVDFYLRAVKINDDSTDVVLDSTKASIVLYVDANGTIHTKGNVGAAYADSTGAMLTKNITYQFVPFDTLTAMVNLPEGVDSVAYDLVYKAETGGNNVGGKAVVAFDGNDVYVKGLSLNKKGWVKGLLQDNVITFPSHQYLGRYNNDENLERDFAVFFNGAEDTGEKDLFGEVYATTDSVAFQYDPETKAFSTQQAVTETIGANNSYSHMVAPSLTPSSTGGEYLPAVPATPTIKSFKNFVFTYFLNVTIPSTDVDGKPLNTDSLYYRFIVDGEPFTFSTSEYNYIDENMTELPYAYQDEGGYGNDIVNVGGDERRITFYSNHSTFGVETVYRINGVENVSDRYVYDVASQTGEVVPNGIESLQADAKNVTLYDLAGHRVVTPQHGVYIKKERLQNGSTRATKFVVK